MLLQERLHHLLQTYPTNETTIVHIDGLSEPWTLWSQEALMMALDGTQKIAVIHQPYFFMKGSIKPNLSPLPDLEGLNEWCKAVPDDSIIIFAVHGEIDGRLELTKTIKKHGEIIALAIPERDEWARDVQARFLALKTSLTQDGVTALVQATYPDYDRLVSEIDKVATYQSTLTKQDILNLVKPSLEDNIFQLTNDLFGTTPHQAIATFRAFKVQKEEPVMFIHLLTRHLIVQAQVLYLLANNQSSQAIAQQLAIHPYRVTLIAKQQKRLSLAVTNTILTYLAEVDLKIKTGSPDRYSEFEWFLMKVIQLIS